MHLVELAIRVSFGDVVRGAVRCGDLPLFEVVEGVDIFKMVVR